MLAWFLQSLVHRIAVHVELSGCPKRWVLIGLVPVPGLFSSDEVQKVGVFAIVLVT